MKKLFLFIAVFSMSFLKAQNIEDALIYSDQNLLGTARYSAMSGAFGALGGDLSSLHINPAGSAVFLNSTGALTLSGASSDNRSNYFEETSTISLYKINLNQLGAVFVYNNQNEASVFNRLAIGLSYTQTNDNFNKLFVSGNSNSSIAQYFESAAQGIPLQLITVGPGETIDGVYSSLGEEEGFNAQQAFLGNETFVINPEDETNTENTTYTSNVGSGIFDQEYTTISTGINGKFSVNAGIQINKKFYIGANLNSHFINYDRLSQFDEVNDITDSGVNRIIFENRLSTTGSGFSAQIGAIAKITPMLRVGASLQTPTFYQITEETTQGIQTESTAEGTATVTPDVVNIFPSYQLTTPAVARGSVALLFGQRGLISVDYSYKDYASTAFASIENPFINTSRFGEKNGFSFGLGYAFKKMKIDFAYNTIIQEQVQQFFPNSGFSNQAMVRTQRDITTLTLSFNL